VSLAFMKPQSAVVAVLVALALAPAALAAKPKPQAPAPPPPPAPPTDADMRTPDPQDLLVIETTKGRILVELNDVTAPAAAARMRQLARQGVYNGRLFFRVLDNFMDQTGDPVDSGVGASSLPNLQPEFTFKRGPASPFVLVDRAGAVEEGFVGSLPVFSQPIALGTLTVDHTVQAWGTYCPGVIGMARSDDTASGNSQFFLMRTNANSPDHATHALDKLYSAAGRVIAGQDVVDAIKTGEPVAAPQDKMISVKVVADMPEATRPKVRIVDAGSAWARAAIARQQADLAPDFTVCSVKLPVEVK
jgi:peptidylprolyl isomerase